MSALRIYLASASILTLIGCGTVTVSNGVSEKSSVIGGSGSSAGARFTTIVGDTRLVTFVGNHEGETLFKKYDIEWIGGEVVAAAVERHQATVGRLNCSTARVVPTEILQDTVEDGDKNWHEKWTAEFCGYVYQANVTGYKSKMLGKKYAVNEPLLVSRY